MCGIVGAVAKRQVTDILVKLNKATDTSGTDLSPRLDWASATTTHDMPDHLPDLAIVSALKLQVKGSAALDVAGVLVAHTGDVELTFATLTVSGPNGLSRNFHSTWLAGRGTWNTRRNRSRRPGRSALSKGRTRKAARRMRSKRQRGCP